MVGEIAENFSLEDQNENIFELYKNLDTKILLVFYPKDDSLICTKQLSDYNRNLEVLLKNNIQVVAINAASSKSHQMFCVKQNFKFPILSDKTKKVSKKYNALNLFGLNKRKLVLIDTNKRISFEKVSRALNFVNVKSILNKVNH